MRKFLLPVSLGHGGVHHGVGALPVGELAGALAGEQVCARRQGIEHLHHFVRNVANPLRPLAVGTVHVVVAHCDVECALRFFPERVQVAVVALKTSCERAVVARFVVSQRNNLNPGGNGVYHLMSVHPPRGLVFLLAVLGNVFRKHVYLTVGGGGGVVVSAHVNLLARRCPYFQNRGELAVVRQGADNLVPLAALRGIGLHAVIPPLGDFAFDELVPVGILGRNFL